MSSTQADTWFSEISIIREKMEQGRKTKVTLNYSVLFYKKSEHLREGD